MTHVLDDAPAHFRADVQRLNDALAAYILTDSDGWQGISPEAPADLLRLYGSLTSLGYANGWLT